VGEEVVPQIRLHAAAGAVEELAHAVAGDAPEGGHQDDEAGVAEQDPQAHVGAAEGVDGRAQETRRQDGEGVGQDHHEEAQEVFPPVRDGYRDRDDGAERSPFAMRPQLRRGTCGLSMAY
jgi:hypothetical protein